MPEADQHGPVKAGVVFESQAEQVAREYQQRSTAEVELLRLQVRMLGDELQQVREDYRVLHARYAECQLELKTRCPDG